MSRRFFQSVTVAFLAMAASLYCQRPVNAQDQAILSEIYGHGVHAYYAGNMNDATMHLSSAIDGGLRDPRAYYFRGIVAYAQGRPYEAEADWKAGADLEASAVVSSSIGQSLSRFQGSGRLKLEEIRQRARLEALANRAARSDARLNEIGVAPAASQPVAGQPAPRAAAPAAVAPAPVPPAAPAADNPFADDGPIMAAGDPAVQSDNALEGTLGDPFKDDTPIGGDVDAGAGMADGADPFAAGGADAAGAADPFGGAAGGADPFGGGGGDAMGADPFGGDPFGN
ncbi:hypothetical protein [Stieleria varia]|uniref:Tetratricopeptide repeat protein n=1 Tax=Stieleria varia TaxID=2528005 RepID=A0A5C6ALL9_9BACT|nr:hypothetical protein [Stieleria varia]TWU00923.1 hypothetical protein Pla52n_42930 [Stieleria varia]